jgi:hypothetical protein
VGQQGGINPDFSPKKRIGAPNQRKSPWRARAGLRVAPRCSPRAIPVPSCLFAVVSGTVNITVPSNYGREAIISLFHGGEIFGDIALLDGQPRTADAVAMSDCELIVIARRDFLSFVHGESKVATKLLALLYARLRTADARIEETGFSQLAGPPRAFVPASGG